MDQRAAEREQLAHAARQAARRRIAFRLQVHLAQQSLDPRLQFVRRDPVGACKKAQVLEDGQIRIEAESLRHVAKLRPYRVALLPRICPINRCQAGCRMNQSAKHTHRRRLAGAVRTEESENLSTVDLEGEIAHRLEIAVRFRQAAKDYDWLVHLRKTRRCAFIRPLSRENGLVFKPQPFGCIDSPPIRLRLEQPTALNVRAFPINHEIHPAASIPRPYYPLPSC